MDLPEYQLKTHALQRRLGDYLLTEEVLNPDQLDEAIEFQCLYGGRLGTSLVELGFVTEEHLAQVLSQQLKLHYIKPDLLMNVPQGTLNLVPENIAIKYRVVPYHKEGRRLFLAMKDASNLADIDELSFQLDHIIVPLAIPEIRLMLALKKHYNLSLSPRFESLAASMSKRSVPATKQPDTALVQKNQAEQDPWPLLGERNYNQDDTDNDAYLSATTPPTERSNQAREAPWPLLGELDHDEDDTNNDAYFSETTPPTELSFTSLCQQLTAAYDRNDIARALINYLGQELAVSALLMVSPTSVSGWLATAEGMEPDGFDQLSIPLNEHSVFSRIIKSKQHYLGPVTDAPQNHRLLQTLKTPPPRDALIFPLMVRDRLICILYIQDQTSLLERRLNELQNLVKKVEMTFTLLILKNKILTT